MMEVDGDIKHRYLITGNPHARIMGISSEIISNGWCVWSWLLILITASTSANPHCSKDWSRRVVMGVGSTNFLLQQRLILRPTIRLNSKRNRGRGRQPCLLRIQF